MHDEMTKIRLKAINFKIEAMGFLSFYNLFFLLSS
jgi:hypothetical protein